MVLSPHGQLRVQEDLGVNVTVVGEDAYMVSPQHFSKYRPLGQVEEMYLRDMEGETVPHEQNPGIRVEPEFVPLERICECFLSNLTNESMIINHHQP